MQSRQTIVRPLICCVLLAAAVFQGCDTIPDASVPNTNPNQDVPNPDAKPAPVLNSDGDMPAGWLFTDANHIFISDGNGGSKVFDGRGANLQDTRGCVACLWDDAKPEEVKRRADVLIDEWGATFVRLTLESHADGTEPGAVHYKGVANDPAYLADVVDIVKHMTAKPEVYVLVSLWYDNTFNELGWPTEKTRESWKVLAEALVGEPKVLFGICNEPTDNFDGAMDAMAWTAINEAAQTIRDVEDARGSPHHIITAQGTGDWARRLEYYIDHPITAGGGDNIAYEIHYYNPITSLDELLAGPAAKLPVIIGEFGPLNPPDGIEMTMADCESLMQFAIESDMPFLAWTFHQNCPPNLIENDVGDKCGVNMNLRPTAWGKLLQKYLVGP